MAALAAFLLDIFLGDPGWLPHPVRFIRRIILWLEGKLRREVPHSTPIVARLEGHILVILVMGATLVGAALFVSLLSSLHPFLGFLAHIALIFYSLGARALWEESQGVRASLEGGNLEAARERLGRLLGFDGAGMDESEVVRRTLVWAGAHLVDGVIAPLFYAFLGGGPLALAYRAAKTLGVMVGSREGRHQDFGRAAARLEDLVDYLPARLAGFLVPLAARLVGEDGGGARRAAGDARRRHPSARIAPAALGGALRVELSEERGSGWPSLSPGEIARAQKVVMVAAFLFSPLGALLGLGGSL